MSLSTNRKNEYKKQEQKKRGLGLFFPDSFYRGNQNSDF
jgi:hypothetical protein